MPSKIPDRWLNYSSYGKVIEGTRIICFKVPLKTNVGTHTSARWTIKSLLEEIPNLGAVIDLTNTSRYYNPTDLLTAGVKYKKILMPGRVVPPESKVKEFVRAVDQFLDENVGLIGVHCTHGLNRTGYMVCRYLRDRVGLPATEAIEKFEMARGYRMERQNLVGNILGKSRISPDYGDWTTVTPVRREKHKKRRKRSSKHP